MSAKAFVEQLQAKFPALAAELNLAASDEAVKAVAVWFGQPLPVEIKQAYQVADGQRSALPGGLFGMQWLSLEKSRQEYQVWQNISAEDSSLCCKPDGAIQPLNFSPAWFPFAVDGGGNGLAVDLDPGKAGKPGQVITYGPDEQTRLVVAPGLTAFFDWAANEVKAGHLTIKGQAVQLKSASSLLDELHRLF